MLADGRNRCINLFTIQGQHLYSLQYRDSPFRLAALDSADALKCITVAVTLPDCSAVDILEVARDDIKVKVGSSKSYSVTVNIQTFSELKL
ncbi:hypothetical protein PoB_000648100 [Plakobranchus ocellatus]|uniref:Uncharacterized protein n=1 Tax=Plakobranchus ocellatus TaxID=259542 RepID=A0AAV3YC74_9GAST|nr:hypothetical protein PoB_000648100 [Plakobranchus ocellatus]